MNYYFAPLEGITGYIYRNTYEKHFGGFVKYSHHSLQQTSILEFRTKRKKMLRLKITKESILFRRL